MSLNLATVIRENARRRPDHIALIAGSQRISYAQLDEQARRFAGALEALGVPRGAHVAVMIPNMPAFSIAYWGALYHGNPVVPLNVMLRPGEVAYHLNDSDSVVLITWQGLLESAQGGFDQVDGCGHLFVAGAEADDPLSFEALIDAATPVEDVPDTNADDTAVILYTSGTTGQAKGAELSHFNIFYNAQYSFEKLMRGTADEIGLAALPLFHSFGQVVVHNALLYAGGTVVLLPRFDPTAALQLMQDEKVTFFAGVPTMYFALLHHPEAENYDLSSLSFCISGGAPMPVEVMSAFDEKYQVNILEGYGLSETSPVASFNIVDIPKKPGSVGLPLWGVEFRLEDEDGRVIEESGKPGEICIRGHNVMNGYYKRPEATAAAIRDGWFHSGDIATRDDDGFYFIIDRKTDMILRGGFNVYPREIEELLYGFPGVIEAAVIGVPDDKLGEEVKAVIALSAGSSASEEEVIAYCKDKLASYKYPRSVEIVDSLPKGPTGKILKRELS